MVSLQGKLASKMPFINDSIFAVVSELALKEKALNLSQGFPDFDVPPKLIELVHKYMKEGKNQYAPMAGYPKLKEKISAKINKLYGAQYNPDNEITITAGATQAIYTAITSVIKEGDEVIIFEPAYDSYVPSVLLNKGVLKYVKLAPPDYRINWDEIKKLISFNTKMIIINNPHNPTATILSHEDMKELEKIVANRDIIILSDEVYEHMVFDGHLHNSLCRYPKLVERSFVIFSFGKTYHATGWKMGYVLAPENLTKEFRKVFQYLMFAASTPLQYAYCDILENEKHYLKLGEFIQKKRDFFVEGIKNSRFKIIPASGSYFQCLSYENISDINDFEFVKTLIKKHKIAAIPLSVFYHDKTDHQIIRFCIAKSEETLKKAIEILCRI